MTVTMNQMGQDPRFERFLSAKIGEDSRGTDVSVLSMFARLGLDPWSEASDLTAMPEGKARKRLDALMTLFTDVATPGPERGKNINALLAFLPRKKNVAQPTAHGGATDQPPLPIGAPIYWILAVLLALGLIFSLTQGG